MFTNLEEELSIIRIKLKEKKLKTYLSEKILFLITDFRREFLKKLFLNAINVKTNVIVILTALMKHVIFYLFSVKDAKKNLAGVVHYNAKKFVLCLKKQEEI